MNELPLVSCLVIVDAVAAFLARALDSALAQDYPADRLEIVVVDNGSEDDAQATVESYGGRVRYIRMSRAGPNSAVNRALLEARGDLITFLYGEDEWPPHRVRRQVELLLARPEVGLVYGDIELIDDEGGVTSPSLWREAGIAPARGRVLDDLLSRNVLSDRALMVRAEFEPRFYPVPREIAAADWWIGLRVAEVAELDYVDGAVCRHRRRAGDQGMHGGNHAEQLAAGLPIRRFALRECLATASRAAALEGYRRFEECLHLAAQQLGEHPRGLVTVSDTDRAQAAVACAAGLSAWRVGDTDGAVRGFVTALACDPFDDVPRAMLGALLRGLSWPAETVRSSGHAPPVTIVIPVFNKLELTRQCLRAVALTTSAIPHEVVVVDNASTDGTAAFLRAEDGRGALRAVINDENLGFGAACNLGAERAYGEHVVFLNNDTIPLPGWLDALLQTVENDPDVGAVGARLLYPNWSIQHAGILFDERSNPYHVHRGAAIDADVVTQARDYPAVTGACLLVRSDLLLQLGGFSDAYRMYVEDVDLCFSVWAAGYRVRYCPDSVLLHLENASVASTAWRDEMVREGWAILRERWAGRLPARVAALCGPAFAPVRMRRRLQGARAFVGLAFAEELVEAPRLLEAYAAVFGGADDATLVISAPGSVDRLAALVDELGLGGDDCADLLAVGAETSAEELATMVDFVLASETPPRPLDSLPRYDERNVEQLKMLARSRGLAA